MVPDPGWFDGDRRNLKTGGGGYNYSSRVTGSSRPTIGSQRS